MQALVAYLSTLVVFVATDAIWLAIMSGRFYRPVLGDLLLPSPNLSAAAVFYFLLPAGFTLFAVVPALPKESVSTALLLGAAFGFFAYATYDLTNQATLRNWTTALTLLDLSWGTLLGAITSLSGYFLASRLTG